MELGPFLRIHLQLRMRLDNRLVARPGKQKIIILSSMILKKIIDYLMIEL
jgi:hypothetical protein